MQDCDRISALEVEISIHISPLEDSVLSKWNRFGFQHRKNLKPIGQFGVCSLNFTKDCFMHAVHIKGTRRYVKTGSVATIWKRESSSISGRSGQQVIKSP